MRKCLGEQSQNLMTFAALDKLNYLSLQERKERFHGLQLLLSSVRRVVMFGWAMGTGRWGFVFGMGVGGITYNDNLSSTSPVKSLKFFLLPTG